eukprot:432213-Pyramimonas_sp.AAC.1
MHKRSLLHDNKVGCISGFQTLPCPEMQPLHGQATYGSASGPVRAQVSNVQQMGGCPWQKG